MRKTFRCCICHKVLKEYKPIRLVKMVHDNNEKYGAYHHVVNYDFCKRCYRVFNKWIDKHKEE